MTATSTTYRDTAGATRDGRALLRRVIPAAAAFDAGMGITCLAAASALGDGLSIPVGAVRATGGVFLVAAAVGAWTARRRATDVRPIVAANAAFALWCLLVLVADSPNVVGEALLVVSLVASAGTALFEQRLARQASGKSELT